MKREARHAAATDIRLVDRAPMPAIHADGPATTDAQGALRWSLILVWFMRTMAVVWIAKGLVAWTIALGINPVVADFLGLPMVARGMVGFFAVADLIAAVGLWLAAPWGGVLWLTCAAMELLAAFLGAGVWLTGAAGLVLVGALIVVYFVLNWLAANQRM
ncbi:MAG: hypothetical protein ABSG83_03085 [Roseiarcus sp.]|jgi:hypothetical protein